MKKYICPHCNRKQIETNKCRYCFGDMNTDEKYPNLNRQLRLSMILNDINEITKVSKQIIDIDMTNLYAKYSYAYAMISNDKSYLQEFLEKKSYDEKIASHMISHIDAFPTGMVDEYLNVFYEKVKLKEILSREYELSIPESLKVDFELRSKKTVEGHVKVSLTYLIIGIAFYLILTVFGVIRLNNDTKYFGTILYFIIPSLFIGASINRLIMKKGNSSLSVLYGIIVLILVSYLALLPQSVNFVDHLRRVLLTPIEAVDYFVLGPKP